MSENPLKIAKWYDDGLNFSCTGCGECCTGSPGYVWINEQEIVALAQHFNLSLQDFASQYLRKINKKWSLKESSLNGDCVFLKEKKCTVYNLRPKQCKTFPWWPQNLKSPDHWKNAARRCEGINNTAVKVPCEEIEIQLSIQNHEQH
jgi:Fe-S-cluster containining protein